MLHKPQLIGEFKGKRSLKILLRCVHLFSTAIVAAGLFLQLPDAQWHIFWPWCLGSGVLLILLDVASNFFWVVQVRGLVILGKLGLVMLAFAYRDWAPLLVVVLIFMSGLIAHAPSDWRYYSVYHRRKLVFKGEGKG